MWCTKANKTRKSTEKKQMVESFGYPLVLIQSAEKRWAMHTLILDTLYQKQNRYKSDQLKRHQECSLREDSQTLYRCDSAWSHQSLWQLYTALAVRCLPPTGQHLCSPVKNKSVSLWMRRYMWPCYHLQAIPSLQYTVKQQSKVKHYGGTQFQVTFVVMM